MASREKRPLAPSKSKQKANNDTILSSNESKSKKNNNKNSPPTLKQQQQQQQQQQQSLSSSSSSSIDATSDSGELAATSSNSLGPNQLSKLQSTPTISRKRILANIKQRKKLRVNSGPATKGGILKTSSITKKPIKALKRLNTTTLEKNKQKKKEIKIEFDIQSRRSKIEAAKNLSRKVLSGVKKSPESGRAARNADLPPKSPKTKRNNHCETAEEQQQQQQLEGCNPETSTTIELVVVDSKNSVDLIIDEVIASMLSDSEEAQESAASLKKPKEEKLDEEEKREVAENLENNQEEDQVVLGEESNNRRSLRNGKLRESGNEEPPEIENNNNNGSERLELGPTLRSKTLKVKGEPEDGSPLEDGRKPTIGKDVVYGRGKDTALKHRRSSLTYFSEKSEATSGKSIDQMIENIKLTIAKSIENKIFGPEKGGLLVGKSFDVPKVEEVVAPLGLEVKEFKKDCNEEKSGNESTLKSTGENSIPKVADTAKEIEKLVMGDIESVVEVKSESEAPKHEEENLEPEQPGKSSSGAVASSSSSPPSSSSTENEKKGTRKSLRIGEDSKSKNPPVASSETSSAELESSRTEVNLEGEANSGCDPKNSPEETTVAPVLEDKPLDQAPSGSIPEEEKKSPQELDPETEDRVLEERKLDLKSPARSSEELKLEENRRVLRARDGGKQRKSEKAATPSPKKLEEAGAKLSQEVTDSQQQQPSELEELESDEEEPLIRTRRSREIKRRKDDSGLQVSSPPKQKRARKEPNSGKKQQQQQPSTDQQQQKEETLLDNEVAEINENTKQRKFDNFRGFSGEPRLPPKAAPADPTRSKSENDIESVSKCNGNLLSRELRVASKEKLQVVPEAAAPMDDSVAVAGSVPVPVPANVEPMEESGKSVDESNLQKSYSDDTSTTSSSSSFGGESSGSLTKIYETPEDKIRKESILRLLGLESLEKAAERLSLQRAKREQSSSGTLKTVIRVQKERERDKKRSRSPLKMVLKQGKDNDGDSLEFYTIQKEFGASGLGESSSGANRKFSTNHRHSCDEDNEETPSKDRQSLVIPEKSSSFSIHPGRLCADVCCYCFGKFGSLDTPMHLAQMKSDERLQKILSAERHLTKDSCLCDACYRHVDRKANTSPTNLQTKPQKQHRQLMPPKCTARDCMETARNHIKRRWLLKIKPGLQNEVDIDWEMSQHTSIAFCAGHYAKIERFLTCALCTRRLARDRTSLLLPTEIDELSQLLRSQGVPVSLSAGTFFCKLCRYYTQLHLKYKDVENMSTNHKSFCKSYRKRIYHYHDIEVLENDDEDPQGSKDKDREREKRKKTSTSSSTTTSNASATSMPSATATTATTTTTTNAANFTNTTTSKFTPGKPASNTTGTIASSGSSSTTTTLSSSKSPDNNSPTTSISNKSTPESIPQSKPPATLEDSENTSTPRLPSKASRDSPSNPENLQQFLSIENTIEKLKKRKTMEAAGGETREEIVEILAMDKEVTLTRLPKRQRTSNDITPVVQRLGSNPSISVRTLFPGEEEMNLHANVEFTNVREITPQGWEKCATIIQYDRDTKMLWQELQRPYGNQSSFLRHLILLEKYYRSGDLILAPNASRNAINYSTSVQNRLISYEGPEKIDEPIMEPISEFSNSQRLSGGYVLERDKLPGSAIGALIAQHIKPNSASASPQGQGQAQGQNQAQAQGSQQKVLKLNSGVSIIKKPPPSLQRLNLSTKQQPTSNKIPISSGGKVFQLSESDFKRLQSLKKQKQQNLLNSERTSSGNVSNVIPGSSSSNNSNNNNNNSSSTSTNTTTSLNSSSSSSTSTPAKAAVHTQFQKHLKLQQEMLSRQTRGDFEPLICDVRSLANENSPSQNLLNNLNLPKSIQVTTKPSPIPILPKIPKSLTVIPQTVTRQTEK